MRIPINKNTSVHAFMRIAVKRATASWCCPATLGRVKRRARIVTFHNIWRNAHPYTLWKAPINKHTLLMHSGGLCNLVDVIRARRLTWPKVARHCSRAHRLYGDEATCYLPQNMWECGLRQTCRTMNVRSNKRHFSQSTRKQQNNQKGKLLPTCSFFLTHRSGFENTDVFEKRETLEASAGQPESIPGNQR